MTRDSSALAALLLRLAATYTARDPKGIGRRVKPGALDVERLVLAGSLTSATRRPVSP